MNILSSACSTAAALSRRTGFTPRHHVERCPRVRRLTPAAALACLALLAACSTQYSPPEILDANTRFPGLVDLPAQAEGRTVDVLLVHGICTHNARWAQQVVAQLMASINGATMTTSHSASADASGIEIVPATVATPAGRLRFNALIWSPLTTPLKRQLCYDQSDKSAICTGAPPYAHQRALLNARLKDTLIDDCLPDALIYQGVAREAIQLRMRDAIVRVLADSDAPDNVPLVVIAHSMGSKIMFDTLLRMTQEAPGSHAAVAAQRTMARMRILVMAANQVPLLSLADQAIDGAKARLAQPDSLQLLLQQRGSEDRRRTMAPLTLVAFSDPNDPLSYTLPPEHYAGQGVAVYNILVSNAPTWLGLLERPDDAHLDYLKNPDVGRLVACGVPVSALCRQ